MSVMLNVFVMIILQANETFFWPFCVSVINMQGKLKCNNTSGMPKLEQARYAPRHGHGQSALQSGI